MGIRPTIDITSQIMAYEAGELTEGQVLVLFSNLIKTSTIFHLQGSYQRTCVHLIHEGYLDAQGEISEKGNEVINA